MTAGAMRASIAVFVLGVLVIWLVTPIRSACPELGLLPAGSTSSSSPSLSPPLTRTCTYVTPEGTKARKRYVPIVDWIIVAVVAAVVGGGITLLGPAAPPASERPRGRPPARR